MLGVISSGISDVVQYFFPVQSVSLCDGQHTCGSEGPLRVDVETFPFPAAHADGELAGHRECMTDLGFTRSEFACGRSRSGKGLSATSTGVCQEEG